MSDPLIQGCCAVTNEAFSHKGTVTKPCTVFALCSELYNELEMAPALFSPQIYQAMDKVVQFYSSALNWSPEKKNMLTASRQPA